MIHLICGGTGAGKTTYAIKLAADMSGVRFSIDEWMTALYWMDSPQPPEAKWSMERVGRCNAQIWETARRVALCGAPCILDLGLGDASSRAGFTNLARSAGLSVQLHFVDVPAEERWRRVQARDAQVGDTRQLIFDVTREMFDFTEAMFQPPGEEELRGLDGVRIMT
jgi:predicted kinase